MIEWRRQHHNPFNGEQEVRIKLIGVGGTGSNVLDRVLLDGIDKADLVAVNTDIQSLRSSVASRKVQLGKTLTCGLGAGGDPEVGYMAALEAEKELLEVLDGVPLLFICVGLGGGTGSGAAPVIANLARQQGSFVVVFATLPFEFEGKRRVQQAQQALDQIYQSADCVICFENERLGEAVLPKAGIHKAFSFADQTISQSVRAIASLVNTPGLIEIGFDELLTVMRNHEPRCLFGYGEAEGAERALEALNHSLKSPLMDRGRLLSGADSVLVNITGGESLTLHEVSSLMTELNKHIHDNTHILMGAAVDKKLGQKLSVTIISSISNEEYGVLADRRPRVQSASREGLPGSSGNGGLSGYSPGGSAYGSASGEGAHPEALAVLPGGSKAVFPDNPWRRATPGISAAPSAERERSGTVSGRSSSSYEAASARSAPETTSAGIVPSTKLGDLIFGGSAGEANDDPLHEEIEDDDGFAPLDENFAEPEPEEDTLEENDPLAAESGAYADVTSGTLASSTEPEEAAASTRPRPLPISGSSIRIGPVRLSTPREFDAESEETGEPFPDDDSGTSARPKRLLVEEVDPDDLDALPSVTAASPAQSIRESIAARSAPAALNPAETPSPSAENSMPEGDRGKFEAAEPTLIDGQDYDIPTFLRRGIKLQKR